jgi:uncharacterized protein YndB with AHSA1/START domain
VKTLRYELEVNATPETLWRIWSDPSRWGEWNPDIDHVSLKGPFATSRDPNSRTGRSSSRSEDRFRRDRRWQYAHHYWLLEGERETRR